VATSLLIGQTPSSRTVEAERFILRGPEGQELATLEKAEKGATLILFDNQHRGRVALLSSDGDSGVVLLGADQKSSASIQVDEHDKAMITLNDQQGRPRADIALTDDGPAMRMWDSHSVIRAAVAIHSDVPMVTVSSGPDPKKGSVLMAAGPTPKAPKETSGFLMITGANGKPRNVER